MLLEMSRIPKNHPNYESKIQGIKKELESREIEDWEIFKFSIRSGTGREVSEYAGHLSEKKGIDYLEAFDIAEKKLAGIRYEINEACPGIDEDSSKKWWKLYYEKYMELFES